MVSVVVVCGVVCGGGVVICVVMVCGAGCHSSTVQGTGDPVTWCADSAGATTLNPANTPRIV